MPVLSAQDCPECFRRGVRWCWLCVEEEMSVNPASLAQQIHEEKAAVEEMCSLIHWLLFILDERLHAAVRRSTHGHDGYQS